MPHHRPHHHEPPPNHGPHHHEPHHHGHHDAGHFAPPPPPSPHLRFSYLPPPDRDRLARTLGPELADATAQSLEHCPPEIVVIVWLTVVMNERLVALEEATFAYSEEGKEDE